MRSKEELVTIKDFIKECIEVEQNLKHKIIEDIYLMCPNNIAAEIIQKAQCGEDPSNYINEYIRWEKEKDHTSYGKVIVID